MANPRKDLRKWADFRAVYGYFFPALFDLVTDPADERFGGLDPDLVRAVARAFADGYQPPAADNEWFDQIRRLAADPELVRERGRLARLEAVDHHGIEPMLSRLLTIYSECIGAQRQSWGNRPR